MKHKTTLRIVVVAIVGLLSIYIGRSIYTSISEKHLEMEQIKMADQLVIEKLKQIREAQIIYFDSHGTYCNNWKTLEGYLKTGMFPITRSRERITTKGVEVFTDTLAVEPAHEIFRQKTGLLLSEIPNLHLVPLSGETFTLWSNRMQGAELVEVQDPKPINPRRQEKGDLKPLRIGSKAAATLKGNWE